ncbi:MAG: response regulator [Candidatus Omnitrophica bacterium]|nr:response regulator [Candidatus Omnitrophota bacterium]
MAADQIKGCVLLVDDEEPIRESLGELLEACGYKVYTADCVDNGIKEVGRHEDIEAIVSDMKMPGKTGIDLLHHLNDVGKKIPVIFLTGYGTLETCQEAVRAGAFDYILKPIDDKDKVLFPLKHAIEQLRLERNNEELKLDILKMAEEHEKLLDSILGDIETKDKVQKRINSIVKKWDKK